MITVCNKKLNITRGEFTVTNTSAQQFEIKKKMDASKSKTASEVAIFSAVI